MKAVITKGEVAKQALDHLNVPTAARTPEATAAFLRQAGGAFDLSKVIEYTLDLVAGDDVSASPDYKSLVARGVELGKDLPGQMTAATAGRACGCGKTAAVRKKAGTVSADAGAPAKLCTSDVCKCRRAGETCGPACKFCWGEDGWATSSASLLTLLAFACSEWPNELRYQYTRRDAECD